MVLKIYIKNPQESIHSTIRKTMQIRYILRYPK